MRSGRVALATMTVALGAVAVASGAPNTGNWHGSLQGSYHYPGLTFKVADGGRKLKDFNINGVSIYCYNQGGQQTHIYVPSAPIDNSGDISKVYRERSVGLKDTLTGHLGRDSGHGTIKVQYSDCSGTYSWTAKN